MTIDPALVERALGLLEKVVAAAPSVINAIAEYAPAVVTAGKVLSGELTGQAALDDMAAKEASIDAHLAHIEQEAAKLGN